MRLVILMLTECKVERNLGEDDGVVVTMDGSVVRHEDLFDFDDGQSFCLPSGEDHPNITITFPSVVLIMEFGIHGFDNTFPFSDAFVTSYTLSYLQDGHFVDYVNDLGTTVSFCLKLTRLLYFIIGFHCVRC